MPDNGKGGKMDEAQKEKIREMAREMGKEIKSAEDLSGLMSEFLRMTVESALNAELSHHLGYDKHAVEGRNTGNSRNGFSSKSLRGTHGEEVIRAPRDRLGTFEPVIVKKGQTRITGMDEQIRYLYAKGLSTREISEVFEEMYGTEVSAGLVSQVTEAVIEQIRQWQARPLEALYPIVYLDCITVKVRGADRKVINKSVFLAMGIDIDGQKELLGMWIAETEGARFWLSVLTELKNRGLEHILIACVDGLTGFPDAVEVVYPKARIQLCIVHMLRNSLRYVAWKDYRKVAADLKNIYRSATEQEALLELEKFTDTWDGKYPQIGKSWHRNWPNLTAVFDYPEDIRKAIYTTNAIESLNSVIRKAIRKRKVFPTDDSAMKVVFLAAGQASKKWTKPIKDWKSALSRFMIEFEEQFAPHLQ
jgi:transposase-like protein